MNNGNKIILDLCGGTGSWSKPYREAGYNEVIQPTANKKLPLKFWALENPYHGFLANGIMGTFQRAEEKPRADDERSKSKSQNKQPPTYTRSEV